MRILHIVTSYGENVRRGGVAKAASLLARAQARLGVRVRVFSTDPASGGTRVEEVMGAEKDGVSIHLFPTSQRSRLSFSWSLAKACGERVRDFDVVHIHGIWAFPGTCGAFAARKRVIPYVVSPQGMLNEWARQFRGYKKIPYWYAVERRTIAGAAWIHFVTEEEQRQARSWVKGKKAKVIPIGVDLAEFARVPEQGQFRDRQGISREGPLVAFLGRIHPIKGLEVLLRALVQIKGAIPEVILAIAGPDENGYTYALQRLAENLGVAGHVRWIGTIPEEEKYGFLADGDLFVLPSFSENFGLAAVEAMAVGCPVVLGKGVNIAPQVEAYGAGWVVPTDPSLLAEAITNALRDCESRRAVGQAGRRLVGEWYDGEAVAREMLKAYEECLG